MQSVIEHDAGRSGEIETAFTGSLRNAQRPFGVTRDDVGTNAGGFVSEDQPVAITNVRIPQRSLRFAGEEPETIIADRVKERSYIVMNGKLQARPVVHGTAF